MFSRHHIPRALISSLQAVSSSLVIKPTTVVWSANLMIKLEVCLATQSWVNREYRRGLCMHPYGAPVLGISGVDTMFPTFTSWGRSVRKSRTQLHRVGFRPRASSIMMSLEGTMGLNAELYGVEC